MSQRVIIIGVSESGKSSLARRLMTDCGLPSFVYDPIQSAPWPHSVIVTRDMQELIEQCEAADYPRIAVVDEASGALGVGDRDNHRVFTYWRNFGILPIAIAQRYTMMAPNIRVNATDLYLFETARKDCEALAEDYNCAGLLAAQDFNAGDFFHLRKENGKKVLTRHRLW